MSSNKKIDNRLNKLFDEIKNTEEEKDSVSSESKPVKPAPVKAAAVKPAPVKPAPAKSAPAKPVAVKPSEPITQPIHARPISPSAVEPRPNTITIQPGSAGSAESMVAIPFQTGADWSMIELGADNQHDWNEDEQSLVQQVADQLGLALNNARLFEETRKSAQQMAAVAEIATRISSILELQTLIEAAVHLTQRRFGLYHAHLFMKQEDGRTFSVKACGWNNAETDEEITDTDHINIDIDAAVSIVARAARTKTAVISNDVYADPTWRPNPLLPEVRSEMAIPVLSAEEVLGVLNVHSNELNHFVDSDLAIMTTLAAQMGTAIQNAVLFSETQRYANEMSLLNAVVTEAASTLDLHKSLTGILTQMAKALSLSNANIGLLDSKGLVNIVAELHSDDGKTGSMASPSPIEPMLKDSLENGQPLTIRNVPEINLPAGIKRTTQPYQTQTVTFIPLIAQDKAFGFASLHISQAGRELNRDEMRLATAILTQVSIVVQNAQLFEQTRARARREQLLREITAHVRGSTNPDTIMRTAVREIGQAFGVKSFIRIGNADDLGKASPGNVDDQTPGEATPKSNGKSPHQPEKAEGEK